MTLPEFPDRATERLAGYFNELYGFLISAGVPKDRLPSPWHVLSRVVRCLDPDLMRDWLDAYVSVEGEGECDGDPQQGQESTPNDAVRPPRHRPPYLRALQDGLDEKP